MSDGWTREQYLDALLVDLQRYTTQGADTQPTFASIHIAFANARNEALEEAAAVLVGHRDLARASKKAMKTDIMRTKWDGIAEALDDMAEEIRAKKR